MSKEYDDYLKKHINAVHQCYELIYGEPWYKHHAYNHDASKWTQAEYPYYDEHFYVENKGKDKLIAEDEYRKAKMHHHHMNAHHWQYWTVIDDDVTDVVPIEMDEFYLKELVADWMSFSYQKRDPNNIWDWWEKNKDKMKLHPRTREKILSELKRASEILKEYFAKH